jgi:N-acetylmuramic acid 6-phosphate etherase
MVDLSATNLKLGERAVRIDKTLTNCSDAQANDLLGQCDGEVKTAIVTHNLDLSADEARARLDSVNGHLRRALETHGA